MNFLRILAILLLVCTHLSAQELNFTVIINSDRARTMETNVFQDMKSNFEQFLNGRSWTNDQFSANERIKGNMLLTIGDMTQAGSYNATVQIQSIRPVFGTNYETMVLNFIDRNWSFDYIASQPIEFNRFSFLNNISSLLSFYAYISLGFDYDSFSLKGGDPYFEIANTIVNNAQSSTRIGWTPSNSDRRNRNALITDVYTSSVMAPIRESIYLYHRKGLDLLITNPEEAYANIVAALKLVAEANQIQPNSILTIAFMDAKSEEVSNILKRAPMEIRTEAVALLLKIDPTNAKRYNDILKG
ncbi:type IX secretion system protein PorD [Mongoliitalea daihaiensis]|uniref:type IX secretion system protein PorD n=1 Tax=Mongoliitalea daihaiensis TaxID=2782006 RepID=UPI001F16879E|nr:DUF4835 family protein [Mongoliitalea daihaiensis]UJP66965.1 DUF4835 family protein [Mongoliitalea daihaiensis]